MRNSRSGGKPKINTAHDESVSNANKNSTRKLRQARLPFKVITPATTPIGTKIVTTPTLADRNRNAIKDNHSTDKRKRKLSYGSDRDDDDDTNILTEKDDSSVSKENEVLAAKKKKLSAAGNNENATEVVSLLEDSMEDIAEGSKDIGNVEGEDLKTSICNSYDEMKGAGTPQTSSAQKNKNSSATKLQIKLPLSAGKKKRRKSNRNQVSLRNSATESPLNNLTQELSSDDIEEIAAELNPQKRKRVNTRDDEIVIATTNSPVELQQKMETITLEPDNEKDDKPAEIEKSTKALRRRNKSENRITSKSLEKCNKIKGSARKTDKTKAEPQPEPSTKSSCESSSTCSKTKAPLEKISGNDDEQILISDSSVEIEKITEDREDLEESVLSENDNEADDETDNLAGKFVKDSSDNKNNNPIQTLKDGNTSGSAVKSLTPKQVKLMEQRRKAREEKERKLQEEKMKKQLDKEEKEVARKREREEKEELKRKEREEKEEQKRKEREEKERKRLAEIEAKNEEKRKRNEAKEEESRKKEEERKRKEHEKEEAELKKKKAAQAFTKFFVAKTPTNVQPKNEEDSNTADGTTLLAFRPFQIKGDMQLAPILRKIFNVADKARLDDLLGLKNRTEAEKIEDEDDTEVVRRKPFSNSQLYLADLRSGKILPGKWRRPSIELKDDVILVEDELDRVGQEIVEDTPAYIREEMRVKFYKFHDNRRPPYYGTWRKKSTIVKPRKPFAQDTKYCDYEVDSDDEWEEEEPGESLEDGSDEDKEKESEDDDYEVDNEWFVPHGHLSDEELQNEDEFGMGDENTREAQKAKLQLLQQEFAQEMKKKTEKIKPRLIGCIWADIDGKQPTECAKIIWDTLQKKAMLFSDTPLIEEPEFDRSSEANSPTAASNCNAEKAAEKLKPISLSSDMVKDLTRLVHGNSHAKNFLINEYIAYIEKTEESVKNGGSRKPLKSVVRDKIDEIAEWQVVDANASSVQAIDERNDDNTNDRKKKKVKRRLCWVVKQEVLDQMDLSSLELKNSWKYTLPPKFLKAKKEVKSDNEATKLLRESISTTSAETSAEGKTTKPKNAERTPSENNSSTSKTGNGIKPTASTPTTSKENKRVPLLMSVARGQQISTPVKNKLISQFLQQKNKQTGSVTSTTSTSTRSKAVTSPNIEDDDIVILD